MHYLFVLLGFIWKIIVRICLSFSMQTDHASFSGAVRLCKRWVYSQLLSGHIRHVVVELLVAYLYLAPAPYTPPHTPHVAFLRFLHLLAHTDWKTTPFLVNLNDAFTGSAVYSVSCFFLWYIYDYMIYFYDIYFITIIVAYVFIACEFMI